MPASWEKTAFAPTTDLLGATRDAGNAPISSWLVAYSLSEMEVRGHARWLCRIAQHDQRLPRARIRPAAFTNSLNRQIPVGVRRRESRRELQRPRPEVISGHARLI